MSRSGTDAYDSEAGLPPPVARAGCLVGGCGPSVAGRAVPRAPSRTSAAPTSRGAGNCASRHGSPAAATTQHAPSSWAKRPALAEHRRRIEEHAPYDLLVLDGGGNGKRGGDRPAEPVRLLRPGGRIVIDDFTPATDWPPLLDGEVDHARLHWLEHRDLHTVELPLAKDLATLVGTRRRAASATGTAPQGA